MKQCVTAAQSIFTTLKLSLKFQALQGQFNRFKWMLQCFSFATKENFPTAQLKTTTESSLLEKLATNRLPAWGLIQQRAQ